MISQFLLSLLLIFQSPQIQGLVLPHHELAREIIISSIAQIGNKINPEIIVVFSPNHFQPKSSLFISTSQLLDFSIYPINNPDIRHDQQLLEKEHGLTVPMTYLRASFPKAKFVPIAVSPYFSPQSLASLAQYLSDSLPDNTLYVASVDFSHDNMAEVALLKNSESINAIRNFDYQTLYNYKDDHMDGRSAMATFLMVMQNLNSTHWTTYFSTHGAILTNTPTLNGTSYVTGIFQ